MTTPSTPASPLARNATARTARSFAVSAVLGSALIAVVVAPAAIGLVRDQLHISCGMGAPGSEGANTWTCSDGIGYIGVAVILGAMWFVAVLIGSFAAGLIVRPRPAQAVLLLLAAMATCWILGWTWYGSSELVQDEYAPMTGPEYWAQTIGPAAIACALSLMAGLVGLAIARDYARAFFWIAAVGFAVATVLQPGLSINAVPAAGLAAAAAVRAGEMPRRTGSLAGMPAR